MKWKLIAILAVCAGSAAVIAQERGAGPEPQKVPEMGPRRGGGGHGPGERRPWRVRIDDAEWQKISGFFEQHSPYRWQAFMKLPPAEQEPLKRWWFMRYRGVRWLENEKLDALLRLKLAQIRIEDDVFKFRQDLQQPDLPSAASDKLKADLREKVKELVRNRLDERAERIKGLEALVAKDKAALDKDRQNEAALIDKALDEELSRPSRVVPELRPKPQERRNGEGGPRGNP